MKKNHYPEDIKKRVKNFNDHTHSKNQSEKNVCIAVNVPEIFADLSAICDSMSA